MAPSGRAAGHVPAVSGVHHHAEGTALGDYVLLRDGPIVRIERPGHASLRIHEIGICVRQAGDGRVPQPCVVRFVGVAQVVHQVGTALQIAGKLRAAPSAGRIVPLDESPVLGNALIPNGDGGVAAPRLVVELLPEPNGRGGVGMGGRLVLDRLEDEVGRLGRIACRGPTYVDLRRQIHVPAAGPVVRLTPEPVAVAVPRTVQAGVVHVRGQTVLHGGADAGVDPAVRHHLDVAAEQHPLRAPVGVGIGDEVADLVGVVAGFRAGVVGIDVLGRDRRGGQPATDLLAHQRLEAAFQRAAGDDHVLILAGRGKHRRDALGSRLRRRVEVDRLGIVDQLDHALSVRLRVAERNGCVGFGSAGGDHHGDVGMVDQGVGGRVVLDGEDPQRGHVIAAEGVIRVFGGFLLAERGGDEGHRLGGEIARGAERHRRRSGQQLHAVGDDHASVEVPRLDRRDFHALGQKDGRLADRHQGIAGRDPSLFALQTDDRAVVDLFHRGRAVEGEVEHRRLAVAVSAEHTAGAARQQGVCLEVGIGRARRGEPRVLARGQRLVDSRCDRQ